MKEEWLFRGALVPIDAATTAALVAEIKRLIDVVGGMVLKQGPDYERGFIDGMSKQAQSSVDKAVNAMAQPEFTTHKVENPEDWSEWVCPDPQGYLLKCCDCGLVHEMQTRVAKYETAPSEEFEVVKDVDMQAQLRMRRSGAWTPEDRAYRPNGLAQPVQPDQLFTVPVAARKWTALRDEGYKMQQLSFARDGKKGAIDAWGKVLWEPEQNQFKPDWDTQAVLVEEMQRMAKRIEELETLLEHQAARIVDLQTHIENFEGEEG